MTSQALHPPRLELESGSLASWIAAFVLVAGLHAGGAALTLMDWPVEDHSYDALGVVTIELAPQATSVAQDNAEIAPGPIMQEAPNIPAAARQIAQKPDETVIADKAPLAPSPEVVLPPARPEPQKSEEKPQDVALQAHNAEPSAGDPVTAAPAKIEAPAAAKTAAPVAGTGRTADRAQATWQKSLLTHLNANKRYPAQARSRGEQGLAKVKFSIDRKGKVVSAELLSSSGSPALDEEALAVLKRASPLPAPPTGFGGETVALTLPIEFRIN